MGNSKLVSQSGKSYRCLSSTFVRNEIPVVRAVTDSVTAHELVTAIFPPLDLDVGDLHRSVEFHFQPLVRVVCPGRPGTSLPAAGLEVQPRVTGPVTSIIRRGGGNLYIPDRFVFHSKRLA